jgi:hypothetical protein
MLHLNAVKGEAGVSKVRPKQRDRERERQRNYMGRKNREQGNYMGSVVWTLFFAEEKWSYFIMAMTPI